MERLKADLVLGDLSKYTNDLILQQKAARADYGIQTYYIMTDSTEGPLVFLYEESWVAMCGFEREYSIQVHGDYDKEKPWEERQFKLSFKHEGIVCFCLMCGKEVLKYGKSLPVRDM
ncbi:MAG: hypothetical protein NC548_37785 [Lachnospiraceae bacterium]|nr:hypothetical protein [Lachnospiraceae bacterium]MCM1233005.1 hypothetical protein [Ruminococcus flavefaciens]